MDELVVVEPAVRRLVDVRLGEGLDVFGRHGKRGHAVVEIRFVADHLVGLVVLRLQVERVGLDAHVDVLAHQDHRRAVALRLELQRQGDHLVVRLPWVQVLRQMLRLRML